MHFEIDAVMAALQEAELLDRIHGTLPATVTGITDDSRQVTRGSLFIAVRGTAQDGHRFLPQAQQAGATVALVETASATELPAIVVTDGRRAAAVAAAAAYGWPARELLIVGVTGTNGKTTTVNMLRHILDDGKIRSASVGTLGVLVGSEGRPVEGGGGLTTPGPVELQRLFRRLASEGVGRIAVEVSSHSLHQRRVEGVEFDIGVFTNLSRDHLDYHHTMEEYFAAKARLLSHLKPHGTFVINADDPAWSRLGTSRRRVSYSVRVPTEVHATRISYHARGSDWQLMLDHQPAPVHLPLIGNFNVVNALAAAAAAYAVGIPGARIAERLSNVEQVPGRLEIIHERPTVLRDYAHTPDALERALCAVRPFTRGRLLVVFGCGGDRDPGKRALMGQIAEEFADAVILTSDNPRTEDPERIMDDVEAGMHKPHERVEDRRQAIARALELAAPEDVILLAGKGHETYQLRGAERLPFDEREIVRELAAGTASTFAAESTAGRTEASA